MTKTDHFGTAPEKDVLLAMKQTISNPTEPAQLMHGKLAQEWVKWIASKKKPESKKFMRIYYFDG